MVTPAIEYILKVIYKNDRKNSHSLIDNRHPRKGGDPRLDCS